LTGAEVLDEAYMVARWSANRLGMLWPEVETPGHPEFTAKCAL
jgi:hypothetical protein